MKTSNAAQAWRLTARWAKRFAAIGAFGAAVALALSYFATLGYLVAFGRQAIWLASFADYLPTALAFFPFALVITMLSVGLSALLPRSTNTPQAQMPPYEQVLRLVAFECLVVALAFFLAAEGPFRELWPLALLLFVLPIFGVVHNFVSEQTRPVFLSAALAFAVAVVSFAFGNIFSISAQAGCRPDLASAFSVGKNSFEGCLVWSGERGVLVVSTSGQRVTFYRWDEIHHMTFKR